ncbi:MAG: patatin family protein [Spirochaetes bacterium]|nr:MAG: patatin family protein [Spirochaetota bacterium]
MKKRAGKWALVVEGGGMRGVFAAGVLNAFGKAGFDPFDLYIGVSAGACNLASHLAGQNDRNFDIIERYSSTKRFINLLRFVRGGHLMDLDWLWDVTILEYRLDLKRLFGTLHAREKEFLVAVTSMDRGEALYLRPDETTLEHALKVSSALPLLYRGNLFADTERAADGGVADSIPVREAYRRGAGRITVIRTRASDYRMAAGRMEKLGSMAFRKHPRFAKALEERAENYNASVRFINDPPVGIIIDEIAPLPGEGPGRATRDMRVLRLAYLRGVERGSDFVKNYHAGEKTR